MTPPCKDCTKRKLGCHSACPEYADYKRELEHIKKEREKSKRPFTRSALVSHRRMDKWHRKDYSDV